MFVDVSHSFLHFFYVQAGDGEVIHIGVEEFLSEQALWIRGWKHHGKFEVTVESRALNLSKTELRNVVQDYSDILAS